MAAALLDTPVPAEQPVAGVREGEMVAYWPTAEEAQTGEIPAHGFFTALIAEVREDGTPESPAVMLRLFRQRFPGLTRRSSGDGGNFGPVSYSAQPAYGCWTWIPPKAQAA